ncbi:MAG: flagellar filament capping protein FliD [Oscillospiraceae bacterium]|nr:flagellar filament capping protein FliD [Oscillospiraceae bacterium]
MASSTSSTSSTSSLWSNNRMSGLMSGLDTESLVKSMAANTKNRLNTKKQKLQTLQWKQEAYRSSISKISEFQSKFLDWGSDTSIKANSVMNKYKAESTNDKLAVSANSSATPATYYVSAATAASAAQVKSAGSISTDRINLDFSKNVDGKEYTVQMTYNGTTRDVTFKGSTDADTAKANFLEAANNTFKDIKTDAQGFEFKDGTSTLVFNNANDGIRHTFSIKYNSEAVGLSNTVGSTMGTTTKLSDAAFNTALNGDKFEFSINGEKFTFEKSSTVGDVINAINKADIGVKASFSTMTQSFKLESTETGTAGKLNIEQTSGNLLNSLFNSSDDFTKKDVYGKNGTITISTDGENYTTYTSASNEYSFDGTTFNIAKLGNFDSSVEGVDEITVTTEKDTSSIKETVIKFIDAYNQLLDDVYGEIQTSRPKKNGSYYDPLTDEQEEEMKSDEIEKWNNEAKKGLLYQDNYLSTFVSSIRGAMSSAKVDGFTLYDLGISLASDWKSNGKLVVDEDKLENAINTYGDKVTSFFVDTDKGLAATLNNEIDRAISTKDKKVGYLSGIAGIENTTTEKDNALYSQISNMQTLINNLQTRYENEMERYWKQFTTLETYMSNMQSQSSLFGSDS